MKAVIASAFGTHAGLRLRTCPDPAPGRGEVVVDLACAEVNYPDLLVIEGKYQVKPPLPFSPGKGGAGTVTSTGEGVTGMKVGDRVAVQVEYGAYAEKVAVNARHCYPIPDAIDFPTAAALGLGYQTGYFALTDRGQLRAGESVLVLGATGVVGRATVELAKALGATPVIAGMRGGVGTFAGAAPPNHVVDLSDPDLRETLRTQVAAMTGGRGVDIVVDPVGGSAQAAALRALAWRGRLVIVGFAAGDIPAVKSNYLLVKNIAVSGLQWSDYREREPDRVAAAQRNIFDFCLAGKLNPQIALRVPLAEFSRALDALQGGGAGGKIILDVG